MGMLAQQFECNYQFGDTWESFPIDSLLCNQFKLGNLANARQCLFFYTDNNASINYKQDTSLFVNNIVNRFDDNELN